MISSGTVSNAQYAAMRGIPAIALSAGENTRDNPGLANPRSAVVARLSVQLVERLIGQRGEGPILPPGTALNVNFPDDPADAPWKPARIGTYNRYVIGFSPDLAAGAAGPRPGIAIGISKTPPDAGQSHDEAVVSEHAIAVSIMQIAYDAGDSQRAWLESALPQSEAEPEAGAR